LQNLFPGIYLHVYNILDMSVIWTVNLHFSSNCCLLKHPFPSTDPPSPTPVFILLSHLHMAVARSSVGKATDYGLDGPGLNSGGDEIFRPSRPALGPTQPSVEPITLLFIAQLKIDKNDVPLDPWLAMSVL